MRRRTCRIAAAGLLVIACNAPIGPEGRGLVGNWLLVRTVCFWGLVTQPEADERLHLSESGVARSFIDGRLESTERFEVWVDDGSVWGEGQLLIRFERRNEGRPLVVRQPSSDTLVLQVPANDACRSTWIRAPAAPRGFDVSQRHGTRDDRLRFPIGMPERGG